MKGMFTAFTFLTRLPLSRVENFEPEDFSASVVWFPLVGLVVGVFLTMVAALGSSVNHWLDALLVVLVWIAITGALHLDGAADMADALGAAHRDPERFCDVMKDPHIGAFGVVTLIAILMTKLVTAFVLLESQNNPFWVLLLIPAWARFGAMFWSGTLEAIAPGSGERFAWRSPAYAIWMWGLALFMLSWMTVSLLFALFAALCLLLWREYLKWRLNGMTGDCLGAGIEVCECCMLLLGAWFAG